MWYDEHFPLVPSSFSSAFSDKEIYKKRERRQEIKTEDKWKFESGSKNFNKERETTRTNQPKNKHII